MSFDDYASHITHKLRLAVAIAIIKIKPRDINVETYLKEIRNKILPMEDPDETVCSEDFEINDINDSVTILKDFDFDEIIRENDDVLKKIECNKIADNNLELTQSTHCDTQIDNNDDFDATFCESLSQNEQNDPNTQNLNPRKPDDNQTINLNDINIHDSRETELYTLPGCNTHYSCSQINNVIVSKYLFQADKSTEKSAKANVNTQKNINQKLKDVRKESELDLKLKEYSKRVTEATDYNEMLHNTILQKHKLYHLNEIENKRIRIEKESHEIQENNVNSQKILETSSKQYEELENIYENVNFEELNCEIDNFDLVMKNKDTDLLNSKANSDLNTNNTYNFLSKTKENLNSKKPNICKVFESKSNSQNTQNTCNFDSQDILENEIELSIVSDQNSSQNTYNFLYKDAFEVLSGQSKSNEGKNYKETSIAIKNTSSNDQNQSYKTSKTSEINLDTFLNDHNYFTQVQNTNLSQVSNKISEQFIEKPLNTELEGSQTSQYSDDFLSQITQQNIANVELPELLSDGNIRLPSMSKNKLRNEIPNISVPENHIQNIKLPSTLKNAIDINNDSISKEIININEPIDVIEVIPFKVIEELNKIQTYLKRERYSESSDSGYRSNSQTRSSFKSFPGTHTAGLNQSAHCLLMFLTMCPLDGATKEFADEISKVLGKFIDKLHEDEVYPTFLENLLEQVEKLLKNINHESSDRILKKDEDIYRLFLLNRSTHIIKYTIEKITEILENILPKIISTQNLIELENTSDIENVCYIFHVLEILLKKYDFAQNNVSQSQPSQDGLKRSTITDIWRKKWNPNEIEIIEGSSEKKCILSKCCEILNKIIVQAIDGYSLISFMALQCFNLLQLN